MLAILAICGFNAQLGPLGQSDTAIMGTNLCRFLIPALVSVVILVIMLFYPLKKFFPEIAQMKEKMKAEKDI